MAIAEMRKLNLAAMSYDRDKILDALQKTGAAEIKQHAEVQDLSPCVVENDTLSDYLSSMEAALNLLCSEVDNADKENKVKSDILKDGFDVSYSEFMSAYQSKEFADDLVAKINALTDAKIALNAELARVSREIDISSAYSTLKDSFNSFSDTRHVCVKIGTIAANEWDNLTAVSGELALAEFKQLSVSGDQILIVAAAHKTIAAELENALSSVGFSACPYKGDKTGEEIYSGALSEKQEILQKLSQNAEAMYKLKEGIRPLKVYCDYIGYQLEKAQTSEKFLATERTFLLEAYVPKMSEEAVSEALKGATGAVYYEFADPAEDEIPPTLMQNNKVVSNFEAITNMYSVPSSKEFDPNTVMSFFYGLFLGFIMADIGYGLIMLLGGGFIWYKKRERDSGLKRLSGVFAIGGIFTILWGILFNSFFGFTVLPFDVMPTAINLADDATELMEMWTLGGSIKIPAVLIIALILGTVQLGAGYFCKAIQCWRRGEILDGIFEGLSWTAFSVGVVLAIVGFTDAGSGVNSNFAYIGGIIAAVSLVIAVLTAGRKEKFIGKFTKGFGSLYGIINYASDILSYARLYGLMLSGAVIAQIVSKYAANFITGGNVAFIILGVLLMVVGHVFNIAISLLGAYIHDARLQYVEFYGKFYEGEGELFTPVGSQHKYVYINNKV